jgi:hypothetical protein
MFWAYPYLSPSIDFRTESRRQDLEQSVWVQAKVVPTLYTPLDSDAFPTAGSTRRIYTVKAASKIFYLFSNN